MSSPTPSSAIAAILDALLLARGFCLVIAVGPAGSSTLARWSLRARLQAASKEAIWHDLRTGELDVAAITERSTSGGPIILLAGLETLLEEERARCLASMNRRRDEWGAAAVRLVLWCEPRTLDAVWRHAPDLLHWRALLQVIEVADLPVYDVESYLAWCVDAYRERSEDRVLVGGGLVYGEPLLVPLDDAGPGAVDVSSWIGRNRRSLVNRGVAHDPRYPVKAWSQAAARRRLLDEEDLPLPILIYPRDVGPLFEGRLSLGATPIVGECARALMGEEHVIFVIDDGGDVDPCWARRIDDDTRGRWMIVSDRPEAWTGHFPWPQAVVMALLDPTTIDERRGDVRGALELARLLLALFSSAELRRFVDHYHGDLAPNLPASEASPSAFTSALVDLLLRRGQIDTLFFDRLRATRPRRRQEIDRVAELFVARSRFA